MQFRDTRTRKERTAVRYMFSYTITLKTRDVRHLTYPIELKYKDAEILLYYLFATLLVPALACPVSCPVSPTDRRDSRNICHCVRYAAGTRQTRGSARRKGSRLGLAPPLGAIKLLKQAWRIDAAKAGANAPKGRVAEKSRKPSSASTPAGGGSLSEHQA